MASRIAQAGVAQAGAAQAGMAQAGMAQAGMARGAVAPEAHVAHLVLMSGWVIVDEICVDGRVIVDDDF